MNDSSSKIDFAANYFSDVTNKTNCTPNAIQLEKSRFPASKSISV